MKTATAIVRDSQGNASRYKRFVVNASGMLIADCGLVVGASSGAAQP